MKDKYLIDTNLLITAFTSFDSKEKKKIVVDLITTHITDKSLVLSTQNYIEFINVIKNKLKCMTDKELNEVLRNLSNTVETITYGVNTIQDAFALSVSKKINFYDALLLQNMLDHKISTIYTSTPEVYSKIKEIKVINPFKKLKK